jgi:hypothetical protein
VIIHNTVPDLALISFMFEIVLFLRSPLGFRATIGKSGFTSARGQCFSSPVEYASA